MKDIPKAYNPQDFEDKIYKKWEDAELFNPDTLKRHGRKTFSIVLPPPNVTGTLHLGHAAMLAIEDLMIRYKRMQDFDTLWLPGTDHAAIATQNVVEKKLYKEQGKTRHDLGREAFLKEVDKFVEQSQSTIKNQMRKMGSSLDWSREAFTLDEIRNRAVKKAFKKMYDDGLIYRGCRIVNWCPRCHSTLADDEVDYKEQQAKLYFFKYDKDFPLTIATTRPETKLGDTAVAVNPKDKRYRNFIGKTFDVEFVGVPLKIKIIGDEQVDMEFGTGALGVTPAHSAIDYEIAQKNKLEVIKIINEEAKMTDKAGKYAGLTVDEARKEIVKELEKQGLMEKIEDLNNNLSVCYRCKTPIEPLTSDQWFVNVNKKVDSLGMSLKDKAIEVVENGKIKFIPERFKKTYLNWMKNLHDWCISRQIWYGHRIPVWYCDECHEIIVSEEEPIKCSKCANKNLRQDEDTLDTWFSSGMWTFTTMLEKNFKDFSKENNPLLKRFHPTTVLETAYDIIFFWVARMILMTNYYMEEIPFEYVYIHGLVRDKEGEKMSKSKPETAIDPLDAGAKYGFDAVRLSLLIGNTAGNDIRLYDEKIEGFRNFVNKLWNISRFILMNVEGNVNQVHFGTLTLADKWILSRFNFVKKEVTKLLDEYNFSQAGEILREFTWSDLADWYLEIAKVEKNKETILLAILKDLLKLWHPYIPFVTEAIWQSFAKDNIMISDWPKVDEKMINEKAEKEFAKLKDIIVKIRNLRAEYKVEAAKKIKILFWLKDREALESQFENMRIIMSLAKVSDIEYVEVKPVKAISGIVENIEFYLPLADLVDVDKEKARLEKEIANLDKFLNRLNEKLTNEEFLKSAPPAIVEKEKSRQKEIREKLNKLKEQLKELV